MKYTLLHNGQIISGKKIIKGDLLIGNSRIMAIEETIHHHSFEAEVMDLKGKYVLPGLLHYNCPFLASHDTSAVPNTSIYQAISHGATFIMDTVNLSQEDNCIEQLFQIREGCKPIISDFGFHLGMQGDCDLSSYNIEYCFVHEGITSHFLRGNFQSILPASKIEKIFQTGARQHTLFAFDLSTLRSGSNTMKEYLKSVQALFEFLSQSNCLVLVMDVAYRNELELITPYLKADSYIYAALNVSSEAGHEIEGENNLIGIDDLLAIKQNSHVMLLPPVLSDSKADVSSFIEHGRNISFIEKMHRLFGAHGDCLLPTLCELYATRPARLLGIYPRKGILKPGSDADLIIWSPTSVKTKPTEPAGTANTALLRKDIKKLFISGVLLENDDPLIQTKMNGQFVHRGSPIL